MTKNRAPLPTTFSGFRRLREGGYLYVDKTQHAHKLVTHKDLSFFLSRPRRFGKSLFVSTLEELLQGNRELFQGLWIDSSNYHWRKYGVIALDFSGISAQSTEAFQEGLCHKLATIASNYQLGITIHSKNPEIALEMVMQALSKHYGKVALLIDEYDSPILRNLTNRKKAVEVRGVLRDFFAATKSLGNSLDFVFITGVSSFAKAGIFSGMNNVRAITMSPDFSDICGYTEQEIDTHLKEYLQDWADAAVIPYNALKQEIKQWYNGYCFSHNQPRVYNPFSLMKALDAKSFENFWFESGTPSFLIEEMKQQHAADPRALDIISHIESFRLPQEALGVFDVGETPLPALMFQTGYLTLEGYDASDNTYHLGYPNYEVEKSLQAYLLSIATDLSTYTATIMAVALNDFFKKRDLSAIIHTLQKLFANFVYQIKPREEREYHAVVQAALTVASLYPHAEYSTRDGRADIIVELPDVTYVIEIKRNAPPAVALAQIEERRYYEKFLHRSKDVLLFGVSFIDNDGPLRIEHISKLLPKGA